MMRQWRQVLWLMLTGLVIATFGCVTPTYQTVIRTDRTQMVASGQHGPTQWGKLVRKGEFAGELGLGAGVAATGPTDETTGATMQSSGQMAAMFGLAHAVEDHIEFGFHYRVSPSAFATSVTALPPIPALESRPTRSWLVGVRAQTPVATGVVAEIGGGLGLNWVNYSRFVVIRRIAVSEEDEAEPGGIYTAQGMSPSVNGELAVSLRVNDHRPLSAGFGGMLSNQPRVFADYERRTQCVLTEGNRALDRAYDSDCGARTAPVQQLSIAVQLFAELSWRHRMHDMGLMVHVSPTAQSGDLMAGAVLRWRPRWVLPAEGVSSPSAMERPSRDSSWSPE